MRNLFFFLLVLTVFACEIDEKQEVADCSAVTCLADSITIVLSDEAGNNLIENGTYKRGDIEVTSDGQKRGEVPSNPEFENVIIVFLNGVEGDIDYEIGLSQTETDSLRLNQSILDEGSYCCGPNYRVNSAIYNGTVKEIIRKGNGFPLKQVNVVK